MVEDHTRQQVPLPQEIRKFVHSLADTFPLLSGHRTTIIEVEQHCKTLKLKRYDRRHLLLHEKSCPLVAGESYDLLALLEAQVDCDSLEDFLYLRVSHAVVFSILSAGLGDQFQLVLGLGRNSNPDQNDFEDLNVETFADDCHDLESICQAGFGVLVEPVGQDDMDEVPFLSRACFLKELVQIYHKFAAADEGVPECGATLRINFLQNLGH